MNDGRDCPHGRQLGKCDPCDLIDAEKEIAKLEEKVAEQAAHIDRIKTEINAIINDSQGVAGYHLSGNVALWDEFDLLDILQETPAQFLAEHDAVVRRKAFIAGATLVSDNCSNACDMWESELINSEAEGCANRLCQQAKAGE